MISGDFDQTPTQRNYRICYADYNVAGGRGIEVRGNGMDIFVCGGVVRTSNYVDLLPNTYNFPEEVPKEMHMNKCLHPYAKSYESKKT